LLFTFFYLYFYPFGYSKEYIITQDNILEDKGDISFSKGKEEANGLLHITVDPKIRVRNLFGDVTVKGENIHILHPTLEEEQFLDIWEYSTEEFEMKEVYGNDNAELSEEEFGEFKYTTVDDYQVLDSDILSFYLRWDLGLQEEDSEPVLMDNQLLLKYENLRIIQHSTYIELRIDEVYDGNIYTYQIGAEVDVNMENELIAVYKKPENSLNGYIELVVNDTRIGRVVVSSPYNLFTDYDDLKNYEEPLNDQLVKDLGQERISLGQELYRVDIERDIPEDLVNTVNLGLYYQEKYLKPIREEKGDGYHTSLSEYYPKFFYNYLEGNIYELKVGYKYPFEKIQKHSRFFGHTPFILTIAGNTEDIEKITFVTTRDPIWRNFISF
jgi:hypothetical protein